MALAAPVDFERDELLETRTVHLDEQGRRELAIALAQLQLLANLIGQRSAARSSSTCSHVVLEAHIGIT